MPRYAGVRRAYDTLAEDYAALLPDTRAEAPIDLAMIEAFVAAVGPHARVLDAGCGAGRMSRHLADRDLEVTGVDLSPAMVSLAARARPDLAFAVGSIADLPFADRSFDGVLLWYSTIHTAADDQAGLYEEAARVLRDGGHLLVGFQAGSGVHDTAPTYRQHGHEVDLVRHRFSAEEVSSWLSRAGLEEVARLVRRPAGHEGDDQAVVLARRSRAGTRRGRAGRPRPSGR